MRTTIQGDQRAQGVPARADGWTDVSRGKGGMSPAQTTLLARSRVRSFSGQGWAWLLDGLLGSSKSPQNEWALSEKRAGQGWLEVQPSTSLPLHTNGGDCPQSHELGPVLLATPLGISLLSGSWAQKGPGTIRGDALGLKKGLVSCVLPSAHLTELLPSPLPCCGRAPRLT